MQEGGEEGTPIRPGLGLNRCVLGLVPSQEHSQLLFALTQSQALNGRGGGEGGACPPGSAEPGAASYGKQQLDTQTGTRSPTPSARLGCWRAGGEPGSGQPLGRAVWLLLRLRGERWKGEGEARGALSQPRSPRSPPAGPRDSGNPTLTRGCCRGGPDWETCPYSASLGSQLWQQERDRSSQDRTGPKNEWEK